MTGASTGSSRWSVSSASRRSSIMFASTALGFDGLRRRINRADNGFHARWACTVQHTCRPKEQSYSTHHIETSSQQELSLLRHRTRGSSSLPFATRLAPFVGVPTYPRPGGCHAPSSLGVHPDRATGGDRDHRHPDRPATPRRAEGPRVRQPPEVLEQPQTVG